MDFIDIEINILSFFEISANAFLKKYFFNYIYNIILIRISI